MVLEMRFPRDSTFSEGDKCIAISRTREDLV